MTDNAPHQKPTSTPLPSGIMQVNSPQQIRNAHIQQMELLYQKIMQKLNRLNAARPGMGMCSEENSEDGIVEENSPRQNIWQICADRINVAQATLALYTEDREINPHALPDATDKEELQKCFKSIYASIQDLSNLLSVETGLSGFASRIKDSPASRKKKPVHNHGTDIEEEDVEQEHEDNQKGDMPPAFRRMIEETIKNLIFFMGQVAPLVGAVVQNSEIPDYDKADQDNPETKNSLLSTHPGRVGVSPEWVNKLDLKINLPVQSHNGQFNINELVRESIGLI